MKKYKKLISIFLCFVIAFSFLVPVNAFGDVDGAEYKFQEIFANYYKNGTLVSKSITDISHGATIADTSVPASNLVSAGVKFHFVNTVNSNNYEIAFISAHTRFTAYRVKVYDDRDVVVKDFYAVRGETTDDYEFYNQNGYNCIFIFKCTMPRTGVYTLEFSEFQYDYNGYTVSFGMSSFSVGIREQDTNSLLDGIIDFLKSILEGIKNIPNSIGNFITSLGSQISGFFSNLTNNLSTWFSNIGNWFTDLGNNIKTWFTNLTNNLKTWFDNIGKWFTDLWNNISKAFTDLWDNISNIFNNVVDDITEWWNGLVEWFKNLFVIPDGYMEDYKNKFIKWFENHFGFLYQSIKLSGALVAVLLDVFDKAPDGIITIPQITLPFGNHVILQRTTFSFNDMINSHSQFKWIFGLIRTASSAIVLVTFINYSYNHFNEFIKNRKENES